MEVAAWTEGSAEATLEDSLVEEKGEVMKAVVGTTGAAAREEAPSVGNWEAAAVVAMLAAVMLAAVVGVAVMAASLVAVARVVVASMVAIWVVVRPVETPVEGLGVGGWEGVATVAAVKGSEDKVAARGREATVVVVMVVALRVAVYQVAALRVASVAAGVQETAMTVVVVLAVAARAVVAVVAAAWAVVERAAGRAEDAAAAVMVVLQEAAGKAAAAKVGTADTAAAAPIGNRMAMQD